MVKTFNARLLEKKILAPDILLFKFRLDKELKFTAGQYLVLKVPHNDTVHRKMFSIASALDQKKDVEMIVKLYPHGIASNYLKNLKVKDGVEFEGPDGLFVLGDNNREKLFVALGAGIAPILSILKTHLPKRKEKTSLLWGLKDRKSIFLKEEIENLVRNSTGNFSYLICLSKEKKIDRKTANIIPGRVNSVLERTLPMEDREALNKIEYYLCGEDTAVHSLRVYLNEKGVEDDNIILEQFT